MAKYKVIFCKAALLMSLFAATVFVVASGSANAAEKNNYKATILVSDEVGEAPVLDDHLVNAWGIASGTLRGPWWVANNGTDSSTLYNGDGDKFPLPPANPLVVSVPITPTGIVFNDSAAFLLANGNPARFLFATEAGTFLGWNGGPTAAVVHSEEGAIYKGLAIHGDTLYSTDFAGCSVDAYDGTFEEFDTAGGFEDASIPAGYCPFGIQAVGDSIFVTYALKSGVDDVAGQGHGFVREFDTDGNLIAAVATHGQLNSPWGMAWAPADFGRFSNDLLVGNFGDGRINAYHKAADGTWSYAGRLRNERRDLVIDGLWGIGFGNGNGSGPKNTLYFAAGPDDEEHGYFGKVEAQ